tara:strand:- start:234 stop:431 length:198 start_codon:yes stop_codon:yes gene_type:complete
LGILASSIGLEIKHSTGRLLFLIIWKALSDAYITILKLFFKVSFARGIILFAVPGSFAVKRIFMA